MLATRSPRSFALSTGLIAGALLSACGSADGGGEGSRRGPQGNKGHSRPLVVKGKELPVWEAAAFGLVALAVDPERSDRRGICTGTLVTPTKILTAAHCLANPLGVVRWAVFGTDAFSKSSVRVAVASPERHGTADIAVITLASPAPSEWRVQEPLLALGSTIANLTATVAGFGRAGTDAPATAGIARKGIARLVSLDKGLPIVMASSGAGKGLCFGDSGGPIFASVGGRSVVVGVLSNGASICETGLDTYTSVAFHGTWVAGVLGR